MISVVCMKWGTLFAPDYVNVLYRAVSRNLPMPFRFYCFTDNTAGLNKGIIAQGIPDIGLPPERWNRGCWPKLNIFKPGLLPDTDLAIYFDLDLIVQSSLVPFVERAKAMKGLHIIREWNPPVWSMVPLALRPDRGGQGSLIAWNPAEQHHIFNNFVANPGEAYEIDGDDQNYITRVAHERHYWPHEWCVSFKRSCLWYYPFNLLFSKVRQPKQARIVVFHGQPRPSDLVHEGNSRWGTKRKFGFGPVDWVQDYWLQGLHGE